jgi:hypothetical protein
MDLTSEQTLMIVRIADAVVETVKDCGDRGAPGGHLYAALMSHGMSLDSFEKLMGVLVEMKRVKKRGQLYFAA